MRADPKMFPRLASRRTWCQACDGIDEANEGVIFEADAKLNRKLPWRSKSARDDMVDILVWPSGLKHGKKLS